MFLYHFVTLNPVITAALVMFRHSKPDNLFLWVSLITRYLKGFQASFPEFLAFIGVTIA